MRNIKWQIKQRSRATRLSCAARTVYQLGPIIKRSTSKQVRAQNSFTGEPMLISQHCYSTALWDPVRSVWIHHRMNKACCEIRWDAFKFCTEFCYKQIKQRWCRKPEVVMITIPWCCGRKSRMLLHYSFQGLYNLLREKFKHFSMTFKYFTQLSPAL